MFYETYKQKFMKSDVALLVVSMTVVLCAATYFSFFNTAGIKYSSEEMTALLAKETNVSLNGVQIIFSTIRDHYEFRAQHVPAYLRYEVVIVVCLYLLPLMAFPFYFWRQCMKSVEEKASKLVYAIPLFLPLLTIPAFVFFVDWGRWFASIFITQFIWIYYGLITRDDVITRNVRDILNRSPHIVMFFLLYEIAFSNHVHVAYIPPNIYMFMDNVAAFLQGFGG
jgi:hypothetical protein